MFSFSRALKFTYLLVLGSSVFLLSKPAPVQAQRILAYPFLPTEMTTAMGLMMVNSMGGSPLMSFMNAQSTLQQAAMPAGMGVGGMMGMSGGMMGMGGGMGMMGMGGMMMGGMSMMGMGMMGMGMMGMRGGMMGMMGMGGGMMGMMMGGMGMMGMGGMGMGGMMMGRGGFGGMGGFAGKGFGGFSGKKAL